ncbi:MAG: hypothetical protein BGO29_01815 [Bacteroidales bacterium 36-12]|nr:MAG: hypothetical protein BGO29_01815 [Bacteroidales bacterium 36-12]
MKRYMFFTFFCLQLLDVFSQTSYSIPSSISVANASVADVSNISPFQNPAIISNAKHTQLSFLFENKYLIPELATKNILVIIPSKHDSYGISMSHYGFSIYHEVIVGASYARNFYGKFNLGMQFNYHTAFFDEANQYNGIIYPQIGLTIPFSNKLTFGFQVYNPFGSNIKGESLTKYVPTVYSLGCNYKFSTDLYCNFQIDKELSNNYRIATGFEYMMMKTVRFKIGLYAHEFVIPCFGFGYDYKNFGFDIMTEIHPILGICPIALLKINLFER